MLNGIDLQAFRAEFEKTAITRAAVEAQKALAAGNVAGAQQIGQAYGKAGLKPRYLKDVSLGGQEAGVDLMMGSSAPQRAVAQPAVQQRLQAMKGRKAQLGLAGRSPTPSVMRSAAGRKALLGAPATAAAAPAEAPAGLLARKMYKPDSPISRGEFTTETVRQKKQMTDVARGLSPEAKEMVPRMSGPITTGAGTPLQRTISYADYVPGIQDVRGKRVAAEAKGMQGFSRSRPQIAADTAKIEKSVLNPMEAKGQGMLDVMTRKPSGGKGYNWGNIARTPEGKLKVLDFLPGPVAGSVDTPMQQSLRTYKPSGGSRFGAAGGSMSAAKETERLQALRKETFKPKLQVTKPTAARAALKPSQVMATGAASPQAKSGIRSAVGSLAPTRVTGMGVKPVMPTLSPMAKKLLGRDIKPVMSASRLPKAGIGGRLRAVTRSPLAKKLLGVAKRAL